MTMDDDIAYAIQELELIVSKATAHEQAGHVLDRTRYEWFAIRTMAENALSALTSRKAA